jgi:hypothetical protein
MKPSSKMLGALYGDCVLENLTMATVSGGVSGSERNSTRTAEEDAYDDGAVMYIIAVLVFYSCGIVVMIIKYLKTEQEEMEEQAVLDNFIKGMPKAGQCARENHVNKVAIQAFHALTSASEDPITGNRRYSSLSSARSALLSKSNAMPETSFSKTASNLGEIAEVSCDDDDDQFPVVTPQVLDINEVAKPRPGQVDVTAQVSSCSEGDGDKRTRFYDALSLNVSKSPSTVYRPPSIHGNITSSGVERNMSYIVHETAPVKMVISTNLKNKRVASLKAVLVTDL